MKSNYEATAIALPVIDVILREKIVPPALKSKVQKTDKLFV